jgi:hypothetical protein
MESAFAQNTENKRFELHVENQIAFIDYIITNENVVYLTHTEVPESLSGKGVGVSIVEKTLQFVKDNNYKLVPQCSFIVKYIVKHPEWKSIVVTE